MQTLKFRNKSRILKNLLAYLLALYQCTHAAQRKIPDLPKKAAVINAETKKLSEPLDYSSVINAISERQTAYQNSVLQMKQITNPNEDFVIQRLKGILNISGYQAVTEDICELRHIEELHKSKGGPCEVLPAPFTVF